ncbi:hypothetical protein FACS1894166_04650 [Bacilli bacterium]|nr:hypothetical protein FACS1894166_04650 [Bacilli bacterium]
MEAITINQVGLLSINPNLSPDTYKFNVTATHGDASSKKEIALTITSATLTGLSISGDDTINRYNYQNEMWNNSHFYTVTPIPQHATLSSIQ